MITTAPLRDFFSVLFPHAGAGFIELRSLPGGVQGFYKPRDFEGIERFTRLHSETNLFFGVASRRGARGGSLENCGKLYALFCDIDFKSISESEARARLDHFPLKPGLIVMSGDGLHVYFLLREPLDLQSEAARARSLLRRLALTLGGDLASAEPARILRIPGTFNYKYQPARRVLIESFEPERAYNPSALDDLLAGEPEPTARENGKGETQAWLRLLQGSPEHERHATALKIAGHYLAIGWQPEEVEALLRGFAAQCTPPYTAPEEIADVKRIVRDLAAKDAAKPEAPDPLSPLRALPDEPSPEAAETTLRAMLTMLSGTDPLQRARLRAEAISIFKLKKVPGAAHFVDAAFATTKANTEATDNAMLLADPEPWPDPVDGAALLAEIERAVRRFVVLPLESAATAALWVLFAHAHDGFDISPILTITSATMRCGKTLLLQIVSALVPKALATSNITPAALFRTIEAYGPTLLIDEGDSFIEFSEELRGILNSGHTRRGAVVIRTVGEEFTPRTFRTWCPKVLALIGKPPGTLADRSIEIRMQRKTKAEQVERFRSARLADLAPLCRQAARWVADHGEELKAADPEVPSQLNDRAADNWRPLFAIAAAAGGEWPDRAQKAALALAGETTEESSLGVTLIGDMMLIFKERQIDELATSDLIAKLVKQEERPWSEWRRGKPITPRGVAGLLKPFRIASKVIRFPDGTQHGYERRALEDAHTRYFDPSNPKYPKQSNEYNKLDPLSNPKQDPSVSDRKSDLTIRIHSDISDVSDRNPEIRQENNFAGVEEGVL